MKRRLLLTCLVCLVMVLGMAFASAADELPIKVAMSVNPKSMPAPQTVEVAIKITNVADEDLPGAVSLLDPAGNAVTSFGDGGSTTLAKGASITWTGTWDVTEKQLEAGKIRYQVKYPAYSEDGSTIEMKNLYFTYTITRTASEPELSVKRTISPTMAKKGQTVTVIYELENTGGAALKDIKLKEHKNISTKTQSVGKLAIGEKTQITFEAKMGSKDITSQATITYKAEGSSKSYSEKVEEKKISYGESKLYATLAASAKTVSVGENVTLQLTLTNEGNIDYANVKVTDPVLGEVFTNQELPAGATKVLTKEVTLQNTATYDFMVVFSDNAGGEESIKADTVTVQAIDPSKKLNITLNAVSDRMEIYEEPSVLRFTVTATNTSEVDAEDVVIKAGDTTLYTFDTLKAGQSKHFVRDVSASMAGKFQFTAFTKDLLGNDVSFESNVLAITFAVPTVEPTVVPVVTPALPDLEPLPTSDGLPAVVSTVQQAAYVLCYILGAFLLLALLLLLVASMRRLAAKRASNAAMDHLDRGSRRDYTAEPEKNADRHTFPSEGEDDLFAVELDGTAEDEPEAESSQKSTAEEPAEEPAAEEPAETDPAVKEEQEPEKNAAMVSGSDGSYRLSKEEAQPVAASAREFNRRRRTKRTDNSADA